MKLVGPKKDLDIAASEIEKMKQTTNFMEFQEAWENFLFRIERAWELTERTLRTKNGFEKWHKPYTDLRKKDPLLVFLKQARNSEMHSISSTVAKPLKMVLKDKTGRGLTVNSVSSHLDDGTLTISINTSDLFPHVDLNIIPSNPELVKFKNRGEWYSPPKRHLRKQIIDCHPISIAELGCTFYRAYVTEAEVWSQN